MNLDIEILGKSEDESSEQETEAGENIEAEDSGVSAAENESDQNRD